ncbi:hypothetical protein METBIDRAFT_10918 [Metschnikowia bicuspidata var. bicuspidata NRRL YB-4993]|uniref:Uncharacterized protein n=1 Tax=Metschnikowia bicuspidata var. bicuspidata NRRL YB-4993 TaxID=869754 RepID=A0A1A0HDP5_9ASCO|nr:hypothetical protein METBIDRAFT_10918 [Metschnikowia bicuspidata var. bicuspidata NRRL YB-4993]OBA22017.1 hypothetical protein METBIDRAFT_10918 [Metschnikowia bicuspidata var. bicuspidata NRRL YB-4993]
MALPSAPSNIPVFLYTLKTSKQKNTGCLGGLLRFRKKKHKDFQGFNNLSIPCFHTDAKEYLVSNPKEYKVVYNYFATYLNEIQSQTDELMHAIKNRTNFRVMNSQNLQALISETSNFIDTKFNEYSLINIDDWEFLYYKAKIGSSPQAYSSLKTLKSATDKRFSDLKCFLWNQANQSSQK